MPQMKRLRFTEFGNVPNFTWLLSDRVGTRPLGRICLKLTLVLCCQPKDNSVFLNSPFLSLLQNMYQVKKRILYPKRSNEIHNQSNNCIKIIETSE